MSKKKKKQQRKQLPVINSANSSKAVIAPPISTVKTVENTDKRPPSLSIPAPTPPKLSIPTDNKPSSPTLEPGQLKGVVLSRFYENGVPIFGKIKSGNKLYTCHSSTGTIPPEGTGVIFTSYTHEAKLGRQVPSAKIVRVNNAEDDGPLKTKVTELNNQPKLKVLHLQDFLLDETLDPTNVMGRTPEGDVVYLLENSWQ